MDGPLTTLLRLLVLAPLAYIAALIAAATLVTFALFGGQIDAETFPIAAGMSVGVMLYAGMISFVPALITIALAEVFRWRSLIAWLIAGGAIGLVCSETTMVFDGLTFAGNLRVICLAGGFVGGAVYWLIAGKLAGLPDLTARA